MGKARLWEVKWVAQENSATERQSRAVTSLCTPAGTCAAAGPAVDIGIQSTGEDKCCVYRPLPRFTLPAWSLQASWGTMSSFVIEDSPGVRIALSPSRWFNYLKLFLSKDRKVNSLSAPHLTYKKEIELLLFKCHIVMKQLPGKLCRLPEPSKVSFISQKWTQFNQVLRIPNLVHGVNVYWPPIMCQALFLMLKKSHQ